MEKIKDLVAYRGFQFEMNRLSNITYKGYEKTLKEIGISYIAQCNHSSKLMHNERLNMLTYGLYLASADASNINVCSHSKNCRKACLEGSGYAKIDALSHNTKVQDARILKTRLFFANRPLFMKLMCIEINRAIRKSERLGMKFSIRLNCTSDISPLAFVMNGKNILELYPNVSFYDYTKNPNSLRLMKRFSNYYLTFSRDGSAENEKVCLEWLSKGNNVAVVFGVTKTSELPKKYMGYEVLVGDDYDYRVWDKLQKGKQIVGLVYKIGKNDFEEINGKFHFKGIPNTPFVVQKGDTNCEW